MHSVCPLGNGIRGEVVIASRVLRVGDFRIDTNLTSLQVGAT